MKSCMAHKTNACMCTKIMGAFSLLRFHLCGRQGSEYPQLELHGWRCHYMERNKRVSISGLNLRMFIMHWLGIGTTSPWQQSMIVSGLFIQLDWLFPACIMASLYVLYLQKEVFIRLSLKPSAYFLQSNCVINMMK